MRRHNTRWILPAACLAALLIPTVVLAQAASPLPAASTAGQTTHILTDIQNLFLGSMGGWLTHATVAAQDLFSGLALFELMWVGIQWALKRPDPHELIGSLGIKIAFFALFYFGVIGMAPHWIPLLLHMFQRAGLVVTGMSGQQANALTPANPSAIFGQSWTAIEAMSAAVTSQVSLLHPLNDTIMGLSAVASAIVFVLAYALLAFEALIINIEASVILGAGVFMLAFAGSNWTTTFSEKYLSYVFSIGVKYFVLTVILALGANLPHEIQQVFHVMNTQGGYSWITPIEASFMTLVYGVVGLTAPGIAGSMLSGSPSLSTGSFMGAAAGGAGVAAAGLGAAAGVAGLAGSGGAALAAMSKRLAGGASSAALGAGDMGAMGMLGSLAGKNGSAAASAGGVSGLARSLGPSSGGPAGSVGSGARSSGSTVPPAGGAWTVDSAGTARPAPAGGADTTGAGPAPNIRFGDRGTDQASRQAGAAGSGAAPGQGSTQGGPSAASGATGPAGGDSADRAPPGPDRGAGANTGGPGDGASAAGGADGIADPRGAAAGAAEKGVPPAGAEKGFFSRSAAEHAVNVAKHASRGLGHAQDALRHQGLSGGINIRLNHPE
jgi:type IV secretion system protein TrbL